MVTILAVCVARWVAVFPLSKAINWFIWYRAKRRGIEVGEELPYNYQAMLYWAGLRGAVGVALAELLTGDNALALRATVLVVVVLTVIIFGGTTARMLEILGIRTGVVEEIDSDDEFDIETMAGGIHVKRSGGGIGYTPRRNGNIALSNLEEGRSAAYVSGHRSPHLPGSGQNTRGNSLSRKNSNRSQDEFERTDLLGRNGGDDSDFDTDIDTSDLPPPARRARASPQPSTQTDGAIMSPSSESSSHLAPMTATGAFRQLWSAEDPAGLFRQLDEDFIKPTKCDVESPGLRV
jgi:sodium/hydrogen exchanger-like protein 6/7